MTTLRWLKLILTILFPGLMTAIYVSMTEFALIDNDGSYHLIRHSFQINFFECITVSMITFALIWAVSSSFFILKGLRPVEIVLEANSRSTIFFYYLFFDLIRFFPFSTAFCPVSADRLLLDRTLSLVFLFGVLVYNKFQQFSAISQNPIRFLDRNLKMIHIPFALFGIILFAGAGDNPSLHELNARKTGISIHMSARDAWLRTAPIILDEALEYSLPSPAGTYRLETDSPNSMDLLIDSAVFKAPIRMTGSPFEFNVPLFTRNLKLKHQDETGRHSVLKLSALKLALPDPALKRWFIDFADSRFSEIPIPGYPEMHLYRLDNNTYPMESSGFWIKTSKKTRFLIASKQNITDFIVNFRSITTNKIKISQGKQISTMILAANQDEFCSLRLEPLELKAPNAAYLYPFEIRVDAGFQPGDPGAPTTERRSLGAFLQFNDFGFDHKWLRLASGLETDPWRLFFSMTDAPPNSTGLDPWKLFYSYTKEIDQEKKRSILENLLAHQPRDLSAIENAFPVTAPHAVRLSVIQRLEAIRLLPEFSFVHDLYFNSSGGDASFLHHPSIPIDVKFDNDLDLTGADIQTFRDGVEYSVALFWRPCRKIESDLVFFIHFVPENETQTTYFFRKILEKTGSRPRGFALDYSPFSGKWPSYLWTPGERFKLSQPILMLQALPKGLYEIRCGMYNQATGERVQAGKSDYAKIGQVQVK